MDSIPCLAGEVNRPEEELRLAIGEIYQVYKDKLQAEVMKSFAIGDRFYKERLWEPQARDMIILLHNKHTYQVWVACARVARKWNTEQRKRHMGKPWTWFRNSNPGGADTPKEKKAPKPVSATSQEDLDGSVYYYFKAGNREYIIGPPKKPNV